MQLSLHLTLLLAGSVAAQRPSVKLADATYVGTTTQIAVATGTATVDKFVGVRFAAPPVRFRAARPPVPGNGTVEATKSPPACPQSSGGEEDCLFLSVFAPRNINKAPKAVMIWWYGGALQGGSVSGFDGSSLAANGDVVVLASNYRVGVFGFPGNVSGIPADELNAGFRDQKRALQWIQDNIASFGGDKNKVTIFGDSAGAVSVDSQLLSEPFNKPLFHSAILHSGGLHTFNRIALDIGPYSTGLGTGNKKDEPPFLTLAKALECPLDQALQCVQSKTVAEVKAGVSQVNLLFPPVDDDGLSSVDDSDSARRAGRMVKVPTMVGSTFSEGDIFPENLISSKSVEEWVKIIYPRSESHQKAVLDAYAVGTSSMTQTVSQARRLLHSDYQFACTSTYDADIMASVGIPTWRFMFNASLPNGKLASHGSDVGFLFGTSQATETNLRLSRKMQAAWGAFARNPAAGPGWAKYGSSKASVANIGGEGSRDAITMIDPIVVDSRCPVFTDVYDPNRPAPGSCSS